jgi:hypothetical protein
VIAAGCGGGGDGPTTVAGWQEEHGPLVDEVNLAVERVQASTKEGEPTAIRANCEALRDTVTEAEEAPPVPDPGVEGKLRAALEGVEAGAGDCVRAMTSGDARLLERSIVELREAQLELDTARASLAR